MKRRDLIKQIERAAGDAGVSWALVGEGGNHSVFSWNGRRVEIPRHREINELTANGILRIVRRVIEGRDMPR